MLPDWGDAWLNRLWASITALTDVHLPFVDIIDRTRQPRMPWHDIQAAVTVGFPIVLS